MSEMTVEYFMHGLTGLHIAIIAFLELEKDSGIRRLNVSELVTLDYCYYALSRVSEKEFLAIRRQYA